MLKRYSASVIIGWGQLLSGLFLLFWRNPFFLHRVIGIQMLF